MKRFILWLLLLMLGIWLGTRFEIANEREDQPIRAFGWIDDPEAVKEHRTGRFCDTEAFAAPYSGPDDVFLWDACRTVTGDVLPPRDQRSVGSCVAFGTASAIEHLLCVQIANGTGEEYRDLAQEVIYGGSRVEIGGGTIRGDGSIGAWAARFATEYGVIARGQHGSHDLRAYDEARCREYGRRGVPDELEPLAKRHPVKSTSNVRSWDECRAAIRNGYPIAVCSSQGFTMTRDADGFCRPSGTWMHCLAIVGIRGGARPGAFLLNSWGPNAHTGPRGPGDPSPAGFWADAKTVDRMLKQGDSWAFSAAVGFPPRKLNWYASPARLRGLHLAANLHRPLEVLPCLQF
ncbi:MAG: hypothetical protein U0791_25590 [Gemmataceae bacterium]